MFLRPALLIALVLTTLCGQDPSPSFAAGPPASDQVPPARAATNSPPAQKAEPPPPAARADPAWPTKTPGPVPRPELKAHAFDRVVVLCVGIGKYQSTDISPLASGVSDAKAVGAVFRDNFGYDMRFLLGEQATRRAILDQAAALAKELGERDVLVFYFAGHGKVIDREGYGREGYLVPVDARVQTGPAGPKALGRPSGRDEGVGPNALHLPGPARCQVVVHWSE